MAGYGKIFENDSIFVGLTHNPAEEARAAVETDVDDNIL